MKNMLSRFWRHFIWYISILFVKLYVNRKFNVVIKEGSDKIPVPPFVMVSNHATFFDPWISGGNSWYPLNIMMNDDGFRTNFVGRFYLKSIGAFSKKKGAQDFKAMRQTIKFLKNREPVLIFPEGQASWDGETQPIFGGVEKIIKRLKCSLVIINVEGNFLSKPWWAERYRKGTVRVRIREVSPQQSQSLSEKELLDLIKKGIYNNDIKNESNKKIRFKGRDFSEGLERFLWICMNCKSDDHLKASGDTISCLKCGCSWKIDPHFRLHPVKKDCFSFNDLKDWADWHKEMVKNRIQWETKDSLLTYSKNVNVLKEDSNGEFRFYVSGDIQLTHDNILLKSENGSDSEKLFPLSEIADYVFQKKNMLEFLYKNNYYRFVFEKGSPIKWLYYLRYMSGFEECEKRGVI